MNKLLGRLAVENGLEFYLFLAIGLLFILAAIFNWDFWFESRRVKFIAKLITRTGARIFYALIGIAFIGFTLYPYFIQ